MPSGRPDLQKLEHANQDHCDSGGGQGAAGIGEAEREPDQNEGERMLAGLAEA
jgi:hypothetical protein